MKLLALLNKGWGQIKQQSSRKWRLLRAFKQLPVKLLRVKPSVNWPSSELRPLIPENDSGNCFAKKCKRMQMFESELWRPGWSETENKGRGIWDLECNYQFIEDLHGALSLSLYHFMLQCSHIWYACGRPFPDSFLSGLLFFVCLVGCCFFFFFFWRERQRSVEIQPLFSSPELRSRKSLEKESDCQGINVVQVFSRHLLLPKASLSRIEAMTHHPPPTLKTSSVKDLGAKVPDPRV